MQAKYTLHLIIIPKKYTKIKIAKFIYYQNTNYICFGDSQLSGC